MTRPGDKIFNAVEYKSRSLSGKRPVTSGTDQQNNLVSFRYLQSTISSEARLIKAVEEEEKLGIKHLRNQVIKELSSPTAIRQITPTKLKVNKKRKNNSQDISPKPQKEEKSEKLPFVETKKSKDRIKIAKSAKSKKMRKFATDTLPE